MAAPAKDPIPLPAVSPPPVGQAIRVLAAGKPVAIFNVGGKFLAIGAACPHVGGPLERGSVSGNQVTCPLHGSMFDLESGKLLRGPAHSGVPAYRVRSEGSGLVLDPV